MASQDPEKVALQEMLQEALSREAQAKTAIVALRQALAEVNSRLAASAPPPERM